MGGRGFVAALAFALLCATAASAPARADVGTEPSDVPIPRPTAFVPFSPNVRVNAVDLGYAWQVEPTMKINSAGRVFVGWKEALTHNGGGYRVGFSYSTDGGYSWAPNVLMDLTASARQSDPWLSITSDDRVFFTRLEFEFGPGGSILESGISVSNTTDGASWGNTFFYRDFPEFADKETAAHDAAGNLYWVWNSDGATYDLVFSRSDDGGQSWTPQVLVPDLPDGVLGGFVDVHPNGTVLATWWVWATNNIMFDRSFDGGLTWNTDVRVNDFFGTARQVSQWRIPLPAMAVSPGGTIYLVWPDARNGDMDTMFSRSTDGGATWSPALRINDDVGVAHQWMPDLALDPFGGIHVAWLDDRNGDHDVYYANSTDGGLTFGPNVRVSSASTPLALNRPGDYLAIESDANGHVHVVWTDGRGPDHDIYFARLNRTIPMAVDTVPPGLAVLVDGVPYAAPYAFPCDQGATVVLDAPSPQTLGPSRYLFASWDDGGARSHAIACDAPRTLTATFSVEHEVRLETLPPNLEVIVNGTTVTAPRSFWWPEGSPQSLDAPSLQGNGTTRHAFSNWSDGGPQARTVVVTAPATYAAVFSTQHSVTVDTVPTGIDVWVDGVPRGTPHSLWCDAGGGVALDARDPVTVPETSVRFLAWSDGGARNHTVACDGPGTYVATYTVEHMVFLATSPPGLVLEADGVPHIAPASLLCEDGAIVRLEAPSPQGTNGTRHAFLSWSDGGARVHDVPCSPGSTFTATFLVEHRVVVDTSPPGRAIVVDGVPLAAPQTFWWVEGSVHTLEVPTPQPQGRSRHIFLSWSDGGARQRDLTVAGPATLTALLGTEHHLEVASPHATASCDVGDCWYAEGARATFSLDADAVGGSWTRHRFEAWSGDSTAATRTATLTMDAPKTVTATWATEHRLSVTSPFGAPTGSGWYAEGSLAAISVEERVAVDGVTYLFAGWTGDASGNASATEVRMDGPRNVTATWVEAAPEDEPVAPSIPAWVVFLVVALVVLFLLLWRRRKRRGEPEPTEPPP